MKTTNFKRKADAFLGAAVVLLAAVFTVGCKAETSGEDKREECSKEYVTVEFSKLGDYLKDKASSTCVNHITVTGLAASDLLGKISPTEEASPLGKILKDNHTKKVALKFGGDISGLTNMRCCFYGCTNLVQAPVIPEGVTNLTGAFTFTAITAAPELPNSVTTMSACFGRCASLAEAPAIPESVTNMSSCFKGCVSLTKAPAIPASITNLKECFALCEKITEVVLKCNYNSELKSGKPAFADVFRGCYGLTAGSIKVPTAQLQTYKDNAATMYAQKDWFAADM